MSRLDELLARPDPAAQGPLDAVRGALREELKRPPGRSWRGDVLWLVGVCWGLIAATGGVMFGLGLFQPTLVGQRVGLIGGLLAVGAAAAYAALAPRQPWRRAAGFAGASLGLAALLLARASGGTGTVPEWTCTASHLAIGVGPLVFALALLRKSSIDRARATLVGLTVGTVGAVVGEFACQRNWVHVATWHLTAWIGLAVVAALISTRLRPRSFAP